MRVILLEDIPKQGKKYDIKYVRNGFARNFLLPRAMAQVATPANMQALQKRVEEEEKKRADATKKYEKLAEKLQSTPLFLTLKIGEKDQAFGSVSAQDIQNALAEKGITIEKEWIQLEEGIKTLGEKTVKIKFPHGMSGEVKIDVEAEK